MEEEKQDEPIPYLDGVNQPSEETESSQTNYSNM